MDYAQARYYGYNYGRFTSPDHFTNDTHTSNPQSWNLYVYVRNNPLRFFDPSGQKAKVTVDKKKGTITIEANFVLYGADGQGVTEEELEEQKELLRKQIVGTYYGEYIDNEGNLYKISTNITVEIAKSEKDAIDKVADAVAGNIVEVGNKGITDKDGKERVAHATVFSREGEKFDRVMVSILDKNTLVKRNTYAHEFAHLLGVSGHSEDRKDIRGVAETRQSFLTDRDKRRFFSEQTRFTNSPLVRNANSAWTRRARTYPKGHRQWLK